MSFFLPYQRAWLNDRSRLKLCQKGRQIGFTMTDAYDSVRKAAVDGGRDVWVMSRDTAQAKQYIRYCRHWARVLHLAAQDYEDRVLREPGAKGLKAQEIEFASGARIHALSSNPDAIAGKSGHVKLDEFALHRDQRTLYAVAKPVIQWGGTLAIISTHRGVESTFNHIIRDIVEHGNPMGWSLHTVPIQRAVEEGLVERIQFKVQGSSAFVKCTTADEKFKVVEEDTSKIKIQTSDPAETSLLTSRPSLEAAAGQAAATGAATREQWLAQQRAECLDEEQWLQEYCCVPVSDAAAFLSYDLLTACTEPDLQLLSMSQLVEFVEQYERNAAGEPLALYLGVDVARKTDLCVFDIGEKIGDVVWDRVRLELKDRTFSEIEQELHRLLSLRAVKRACIDATGMGMQLAEQAKKKFGWKVEPITFTAPVKEELAFGFRTDLEDRKLRMAPDDKLHADLHAVRKEVTLSGNIRFAGESGDSHCDRFWAKALRQQAARYRSKVAARVGD